MKTLFISLLLVVSSLSASLNQDTETMTATFDGYEEGSFYFTDSDGYSTAFSQLSDEARKLYDLTTEEYVGSTFMVTYTSETEIDDLDEEVTMTTIVALKLVGE